MLMNIICLEDAALYELVEQVSMRIQAKNNKQDKWISCNEAMKMLRIKSKTTLQRYRDEGKIRFSQPDKKVILYDFDSIHLFLEKNASDTF